MSRESTLLNGITTEQLGVEIAPWFNPIVPKRKGYRSLSLDVYDTEKLRQSAKQDPNVPDERIAEIEDVDLVGSAMDLLTLVQDRGLAGSLDYVISSHNFEHLPNPIVFLQSCEAVLKTGGIVSMAIPDKRVCFDYFRPHSTTADFLEAYFEGRTRPTQHQHFSSMASASRYFRNEMPEIAWAIEDDPQNIRPLQLMEEAFENWVRRANGVDEPLYQDAHCWCLTPAVLELILRDLFYLKVINLNIVNVEGPAGCEFFVRLQKQSNTDRPSRQDFYDRRASLLHRIYKESEPPIVTSPVPPSLFLRVRSKMARLLGSSA